jgi:hypothetical protein
MSLILLEQTEIALSWSRLVGLFAICIPLPVIKFCSHKKAFTLEGQLSDEQFAARTMIMFVQIASLYRLSDTLLQPEHLYHHEPVTSYSTSTFPSRGSLVVKVRQQWLLFVIQWQS